MQSHSQLFCTTHLEKLGMNLGTRLVFPLHTLCASMYRNVEELTRFSGLAQKKQLSYSAKQLIAREVLILMCYYII